MIVRVVHDARFPPDFDQIESFRFEFWPTRSLGSGGAPPSWASQGVFILDGVWTEAEAKLFAQQFESELRRIEVSDDFATGLGVRPISDPIEVA